MKTSTSLSALAPALVKVHKALKIVVKDSTNPHFKNKYASLEGINESVRPLLATNGFALIQGVTVPTTDAEGHLTSMTLTTTLLHESGEWISNDVVMPLDKPSAQGAGSAVTYGRRYGLSSLLALSTDEDDDGAAASVARPAAASPAARTDPLIMPMGKAKGQPNRDQTTEALTSALAWAKEKDKFPEWRIQVEGELARRRQAGEHPAGPDSDDLPF